MKDTNWEFHVPVLTRPTIDGIRCDATLVMRRLIDGKLEYRLPTVEEETEYNSIEAW